jgi:hypothetical protein
VDEEGAFLLQDAGDISGSFIWRIDDQERRTGPHAFYV